MEAFLRATCDTEYHPVGTCRMGPDTDPMAVVDAQLRVRGVQALRVVDASIMPALTSWQHQRADHGDRRKSRRPDPIWRLKAGRPEPCRLAP
jgi:hypothetical protein